ncbi:hypothetical protein Leryth_010202 [Lithospermum erythrorhizon]|nr:hypothetical protein Leryth_010202 [Lithospermum erythrorhizon]
MLDKRVDEELISSSAYTPFGKTSSSKREFLHESKFLCRKGQPNLEKSYIMKLFAMTNMDVIHV